jgi:hypothetical protein
MMRRKRIERGSTLVIVLLVVALLAGIGIPLLTLTSMGPKLSGSMRYHEEAFNAAEAGFEAARLVIEFHMTNGDWTNFAGHYLTQPTGIDQGTISDAPNPSYFRRLTDQELLQAFDSDGDGAPNVTNLIYFHQTFAADAAGQPDPRYTYTVFLLDGQAGGGTASPAEALIVSIGTVRAGSRILDSVRLEVLVGL